MTFVSQWNWLDYLLAAILLISVVKSFWHGFTREVISLGASVTGLIAGFWLYGYAGSFLMPYVNHPAFANIVGFFAVFFLFLMLGALVSLVLDRVIRFVNLGWLNRLMGAGFGALKGGLICAVVVFALATFAPAPAPKSVADSHLAPYAIGVARVAAAIAPRSLRDAFTTSYDRLRELWSGRLADTARQQLKRL